jgi:hypothetical protein
MPADEKPCPSCGHCPTCGHTPAPAPQPYPVPLPMPYPVRPWINPYASPFTCEAPNDLVSGPRPYYSNGV